MTQIDFQLLADRFSPQVRLSNESPWADLYAPCSVDWYLANCTLFSENAPIEHPTLAQLAGCTDLTAYLQPDNDTVLQGNLDSAVTYVHVRKSPDIIQDWIDIQYWFFYAYNGGLGPTIPIEIMGKHVGDWEHVTVRVSNWEQIDNSSIEAVFFARHGKDEGTWLVQQSDEPQLGYYSVMESTHPVIYSAWHSHASYECDGLHWRTKTWLFGNDVCNWNGDEQSICGWPKCPNVLIAVDSVLCSDCIQAPWLAYVGRFGDSTESASTSDSPKGPSHQGPWTDDGENGFYVDLNTLATFGQDWGESRKTTSIAVGILNDEQVIGIGRNSGDHWRFKLLRWNNGLELVAQGGNDWGDSRGVTGIAFGRLNGESAVGVSRNDGNHARFEVFRWNNGLELMGQGGNEWSDSRSANAISFGMLNNQEVIGVCRSKGDHSRFEIYGWNDGLQLIASGGDAWGDSRGATCIAFGIINGEQAVAVGRNAGDDSRFEIYKWNNGLQLIASGGKDWGSNREATAIAFGVLNNEAVIGVTRNEGDDSRFIVYHWDSTANGLVVLANGGETWDDSRAGTGIAFGMVNGEGVLGVSRSHGDNAELFFFKYVNKQLVEYATRGVDWGDSRGATCVAIGTFNDVIVAAYGRNTGNHNRGGILEWEEGADATLSEESAQLLEDLQ